MSRRQVRLHFQHQEEGRPYLRSEHITIARCVSAGKSSCFSCSSPLRRQLSNLESGVSNAGFQGSIFLGAEDGTGPRASAPSGESEPVHRRSLCSAPDSMLERLYLGPC